MFSYQGEAERAGCGALESPWTQIRAQTLRLQTEWSWCEPEWGFKMEIPDKMGWSIPFIFLSLVFLSTVLSGLGILLSEKHENSELSFFDYAIRGFICLSFIGLVITFFVPINRYVSLSSVGIGFLCFIYNGRLAYKSFGVHPKLMLSFLVALLILAAINIPSTPFFYDTGLYHLQSIDWLERSTKIFGLANLHSRFGFNSIWLIDAAVIDLFHKSHALIFIVNSLLFTIVIGGLAQPIISGSARFDRPNIKTVFSMIIVIVLLIDARHLAYDQFLASTGDDLPAGLLVIYAFFSYLGVFEGGAKARSSFFNLVVSCVLAVMVKVAAIPVILLIPPAYLNLTGGNGRHIIPFLRNRTISCLLIVGAAWVLNGIVLSGCAVMPALSTCIGALPWAVPASDVRESALSIIGWARAPGPRFLEAVSGRPWLAEWPSLMLWNQIFLLKLMRTFGVVAALGLTIVLVDRLFMKVATFERRPEPGTLPITYAILTACVGNVFWFVAAPDPRFGVGFIIVLPALLIATGLWWLSVCGPVVRLVAGRTAFVCFVFMCVVRFASYQWASASDAVKTWPAIPRIEVVKRDFGPSFRVNVPASGDQCWDAPQPCAPERPDTTFSLHDSRFLWWRMFEPVIASTADATGK